MSDCLYGGKDSYCLYGLKHVGKTSFLLLCFPSTQNGWCENTVPPNQLLNQHVPVTSAYV